MRNVIALLTILSLTGCAMHMGKVEPGENGSSKGIWISIGQTTGPSGMSGGAISAPGADFLGRLIAQAMTFIPGVSPPNPEAPDIVIKHQDSESELVGPPRPSSASLNERLE